MKFGEYLINKKMITQDQLNKALKVQEQEEKKYGFHRKLGSILLSECFKHKCSREKLYKILQEWDNENNI
jgi:hypothetical protein